jgi:hypothetical protein
MKNLARISRLSRHKKHLRVPLTYVSPTRGERIYSGKISFVFRLLPKEEVYLFPTLPPPDWLDSSAHIRDLQAMSFMKASLP